MTESMSHTVHIAWQQFSDGLLSFLKRRTRQPADAEDLLQQVFLRLASEPKDKAPENIGGWLYRVARNVLIDAHRRGRLRQTVALPDDVCASEDNEADRGMSQCIEPMLHLLPPTYAEALREADLENQTQRSIAESLGLSVSAVKSRVQRARVMLRDEIVACCGAPDGDMNCEDCGSDRSC